MEKNTIIVGLIIFLVGLGGGYALKGGEGGGNGVGNRDGGGHMMANGSMMGQGIDQHFIVQMIPHHEGAIDMAELARTRSKRPEILSLSNAIIEAQEKEITDMTSWHTAWFGSAPVSGSGGMGAMGGMHMSGMSGDMEDLEKASDVEFDRVFLTQMIPHHEMAIMMASMLAATTERSEMKQLADTISTSQAREISLMRGWLESWYSFDL